MIEFSLIDRSKCGAAHSWQRKFVASNDLVFPKTLDEYEELAALGQIWCARESDEYLGLVYFKEDYSGLLKSKTWEVGGLIVAPPAEGKGVGGTLVRLALGHVLWNYDPLAKGVPVVAHVHSDNNPGPRPIFQRLKFELVGPVEIPGEKLPGLRVNEKGLVTGDEFRMGVPSTLKVLAEWCRAWNGNTTGPKGSYDAKIEWKLDASFALWAQAFDEMAQQSK